MRKIPTLFVRDPEDMKRVLPEVHPDCGWVLAGEGVATRKYDGTCVLLDEFDGERQWWARREVKPDKQPPHNFRPVHHDPVTGKTVGWEPVEQSGWAKFVDEARTGAGAWELGTYELVGPKVNKNPEGYDRHALVKHGDAERLPEIDHVIASLAGASVQHILNWFEAALTSDEFAFEGIVWHHPDGRMAKLKARDFPARTSKPVMLGRARA